MKKQIFLLAILFAIGAVLPTNALGQSGATNDSHPSGFYKPKGYFGRVDLGYGQVDRPQAPRIFLSMINGYRVAPQFAFGIGTGLQLILPGADTEIVMPVFLHLRSDFLDRKISPFASINAGYNIPFGGSIGGLAIEPMLGVGFNVGRAHQISAGVFYSIDKRKFDDDGNRININCSTVGLKVGYSF